MIVYSATKAEFRDDVRNNRIDTAILDAFQRNLGKSTGQSEINSWKNSMMYMSNVLEDPGIPETTGVAIEYRIPQTSKRIDIILTGRNGNGQGAAVIVELKQWSDVKLTQKDAVVRTFLGGSEREVGHPAYQAWTYASLLEDYNETVQESGITLGPCAYLHNLASDRVIKHSAYEDHLKKAPVFIRNEAEQLAEFIKRFIRNGDDGALMYEIENSRIRPSKNLADTLLSMLQGNDEFVMIDDQKLVFETAMDLARRSTVKEKNVLIVEGGPGTGKSVVAINLLVRLTGQRLTTQYVTKNAAPRAVYESVLTSSFKKSHISNMFKGSGSYHECDSDVFDVLVVDEAHRLNEKSGLFQNLGENQIKEIIDAAKCSVFFLDEDQRVTWKDIGSAEEIERWAALAGASIHRMELQSQFRCGGSDGYLSWLDHVLGIRPTANDHLGDINYDFRVFETPNALMQAIIEKDHKGHKARTVAGYCWDWISKKPENSNKKDIVIEEYGFARQWNLSVDGSLWIRKPESISEVGCIHTCQGLEVDYIGVIVGPDLVVRGGQVLTRPEERSRMDQSLKGYKTALKKDKIGTKKRADAIIKNTYRTLMSRGQKGCYVFCTDPETAAYFTRLAESAISQAAANQDWEDTSPSENRAESPDPPLRVLSIDEVKPYENSVPLYDLKIAAGDFRAQEVHDCQWVELPDSFRPQKGHFVVQVVGDSMNRRIPNGAWCLFKANPSGTRANRIVLVEHRDISDPDTGGIYTVKRYRSEKAGLDDERRHTRIVLSPESFVAGYSDLVFEGAETGELNVIGEFIAVLD